MDVERWGCRGLQDLAQVIICHATAMGCEAPHALLSTHAPHLLRMEAFFLDGRANVLEVTAELQDRFIAHGDSE